MNKFLDVLLIVLAFGIFLTLFSILFLISDFRDTCIKSGGYIEKVRIDESFFTYEQCFRK